MENCELKPEKELKYKEILLQNGITEPVSEILVKDPGLREGMMSEISYVTVKFQKEDVPQLNLFVKQETVVPSHNEVIRAVKGFEKEALFFMEYVPVATKLCREKGQEELMDIYPKCYYADDKLIVLENLVLNNGFSLNEGLQGLEEAKSSLVTLAKHHAISRAIIEECGGGKGFLEKFPVFEFESYLDPAMITTFKPMIVNGFRNNVKFLEGNDVEGKDKVLERLKSIEKNGFFEDGMKSSLVFNPEDILVLNHGDYWNNNVMFLKDKATGKILKNKTIDLQLVVYTSVALDLALFIFTSVNPEVRQKHLNDLLNIYLETLKTVGADLGHPIELTFEELYLEFRKKFKFGFWFGFCITIGPGMDVLKDIDLKGMDDFGDFHVLADQLVKKWIEDNPEKGEDAAKTVVNVVNEYNQLVLD